MYTCTPSFFKCLVSRTQAHPYLWCAGHCTYRTITKISWYYIFLNFEFLGCNFGLFEYEMCLCGQIENRTPNTGLSVYLQKYQMWAWAIEISILVVSIDIPPMKSKICLRGLLWSLYVHILIISTPNLYLQGRPYCVSQLFSWLAADLPYLSS